MKVVFIMSEDITMLYATIVKILPICYNILFSETHGIIIHCSKQYMEQSELKFVTYEGENMPG